MSVVGVVFHWAALILVCIFAFAYAVGLTVVALLLASAAVRKLTRWLWEWTGIGWMLLTVHREVSREVAPPAGDGYLDWLEAEYWSEETAP